MDTLHRYVEFVPVVGAFLHGVVADEVAVVAAAVDYVVVVVNVQNR